MRLKFCLVLIAFSLVPATTFSRISADTSRLQTSAEEPVTWSAHVENGKNGKATVVLSANISGGWHLYGMNLPDGGPKATSFTLADCKNVTVSGDVEASRKPVTVEDPLFGMKLSWWDASVDFRVPVDINGQDAELQYIISFMTCDGNSCQPPRNIKINIPINTNHP